MTEYHLTHLKQLEAESIHIIREVAAEFDKPVMLYSIGKDSAVMMHLALKAFAPGKPPFPLMHIDTTWKFKQMIEFRDNRLKELGWDLIVHINQQGVEAMEQLLADPNPSLQRSHHRSRHPCKRHHHHQPPRPEPPWCPAAAGSGLRWAGAGIAHCTGHP